ncbi:MAG: hypothetical protein NZ740_04590 [Kiritimatiellae bacterium]|nr:hypothetical protein [Kiritimatiellia bacterium]MDW8458369.1 hypothetical protein [Verrucomicrobiota bacterium]
MKAGTRSSWIAVILAVCLAGSATCRVSRAESGVNPLVTIGLLVTVVGVLGWTAWQMEREDKEDAINMRAWIPSRRAPDRSAWGLVLDGNVDPSAAPALLAGVGYGVRF